MLTKGRLLHHSPGVHGYIPKPPPRREQRFATSVVAQILADLMVAEEYVNGPLLGHHVAAVLRIYFPDVRDIWAIRDQLAQDGYWELLVAPTGEVTPSKRLTAKGRALGATVEPKMTLELFHKEMNASVPANWKPGDAPPAAQKSTPGRKSGSHQVLRTALDQARMLAALADFRELEKIHGDLPSKLAYGPFEKQWRTTGRNYLSLAKKKGWITMSGNRRSAAYRLSPEGLALLEKSQIESSATSEPVKSEPPIKVPYREWLAHRAYKRMLQILITEFGWPVADRLSKAFMHEVVIELWPEATNNPSWHLNALQKSGLIQLLGKPARNQTVWQILNINVEPSSQKDAIPELGDDIIHWLISNVLYENELIVFNLGLVTSNRLPPAQAVASQLRPSAT